jgi:hypothetical protein
MMVKKERSPLGIWSLRILVVGIGKVCIFVPDNSKYLLQSSFTYFALSLFIESISKLNHVYQTLLGKMLFSLLPLEDFKENV